MLHDTGGKDILFEDRLPVELFVHIFTYCNVSKEIVGSISLVCKKFHYICQQEELWEQLMHRYFPIHSLYLQEQKKIKVGLRARDVWKRGSYILQGRKSTSAITPIVMLDEIAGVCCRRESRTLKFSDGFFKSEFKRLVQYAFDPEYTNLKHLKLKYNNKRLSGIISSPKMYRTSIANQGHSSGKHFYELKIEKLGDYFRPGIGISRKLSREAIKRTDISLTSWCWFGALGLVYNQGKNYPNLLNHPMIPKFCVGDTIQLFLDVENCITQFALNRIRIPQIEFKGKEEFMENRIQMYQYIDSVTGGVNQEFYLGVSLNGKKNKIRILSHQIVPECMSFEHVLAYLSDGKKPNYLCNNQDRKNCLIM